MRLTDWDLKSRSSRWIANILLESIVMRRWAGIVVSGGDVLVVDAEIPADKGEPIAILSENKWTLQKGDAASA